MCALELTEHFVDGDGGGADDQTDWDCWLLYALELFRGAYQMAETKFCLRLVQFSLWPQQLTQSLAGFPQRFHSVVVVAVAVAIISRA